jgi:hypothetical protein
VVEAAWTAARVGVKIENLRHAIANAAADRATLGEKDEKRFGLYSIQRVFLKFLEDAELREEVVPDGRGEIVFYRRQRAPPAALHRDARRAKGSGKTEVVARRVVHLLDPGGERAPPDLSVAAVGRWSTIDDVFCLH